MVGPEDGYVQVKECTLEKKCFMKLVLQRPHIPTPLGVVGIDKSVNTKQPLLRWGGSPSLLGVFGRIHWKGCPELGGAHQKGEPTPGRGIEIDLVSSHSEGTFLAEDHQVGF